jgi:hypothetical protein
MEIQPVKSKKAPGYPTIRSYVENPMLLSKSIPNIWIRNKYAAATLASFILLGNPGDTKKTKKETIVLSDQVSFDNPENTIQKNNYDPIKVAPIFAHGDGSGAIGCIVMSPPVFISEGEALKIIIKALEDENIQMSGFNTPAFSFTAPAIANDCFNDDSTKNPKTKVKIKMDGYNSKYNLAIEFVSREDFAKFQSDDGCYSSVQGFNTKEAAELIRQDIIRKGRFNAAVFYDPMPSINFDLDSNNVSFEKLEVDASKLAKDQLLSQVADFIHWLNNSGLIIKK